MQAASVFQALSDPTRLRILELLRAGERAVNDVVDAVDIDQSGVSRHLKILSEAGFVRMRPDGPRRLYSLAPEPFTELDLWLSQYRALWESRLDRLGEAMAQKQQAKKRSKNALT
jgi:DNA-binding transcriptional ArsR family regulator